MAGGITFKHPFTCIIEGPTGSRKSTFFIRFLQNLDTQCTQPDIPGRIIWCYTEQSAVPQQQLAALRKDVQVHEGLPENIENSQGLPCFFIIDDLLNEVFHEPFVTCLPREVIIETSV